MFQLFKDGKERILYEMDEEGIYHQMRQLIVEYDESDVFEEKKHILKRKENESFEKTINHM